MRKPIKVQFRGKIPSNMTLSEFKKHKKDTLDKYEKSMKRYRNYIKSRPKSLVKRKRISKKKCTCKK